MKKKLIFVDMDDVLADFNSSDKIPANEKHLYHHPEIYKEGFFLTLKPMPGAIAFINRLLMESQFDVQILTQPVAGNPYSYTEKVQWVYKYFPQLASKINMSQNKLLFRGDVLIDDNPKWEDFKGTFIQFNPKDPLEEFALIESYLLLMIKTNHVPLHVVL